MCDKLTVWTFHGSGWGTIKEKLGEVAQGCLQCYAVQEHHLTEDKWPVVTQSMKAQGYQLGVLQPCLLRDRQARQARLRGSPWRFRNAWA